MKIRTSIKNNKGLLLFLSILFIIGIIIGIIYYLKQTNGIKATINNELVIFNDLIKNPKTNNILLHIIVFLIIFIGGFTIIGIPFIFFYFFYESMSLGFLISILIAYKGVGGLLYSLIFIIVTKFIYFMILVYLIIMALKICNKVVSCLILKKDIITYKFIKNNLLKIIILVIISILNNLFIYYIGSKILKLFLFLI